jgi:hypothetical protein
MDPVVAELGSQLANIAIRNTAATIYDKIAVAKARKKDQETIAELEEVIGNLISDKNDLVLIAQSYEQQLTGQRIAKADVEYITKNIIPIVRQLVAASQPNVDSDTESMISATESLLSVETVNILQLVGFNFKKAVGEPLTQLIAQLISSRSSSEVERNSELRVLETRREIAYLNLVQDSEAFARFKGSFETTA